CVHLMAFSRLFCIILPIRLPPISTLFPYTTLFRSIQERLSARLMVLGKYDHRAVEIDGVGPFRRRSGQWRIRPAGKHGCKAVDRSEEHTSELQSLRHLVCRLLLEKKNVAVGTVLLT